MAIVNTLLLALTAHLPARAIDLIGENGQKKHYMERYQLARFPSLGVTLYLHRYLDSDGDRHLHDHPWPWSIGIPLVGHYEEQRLTRFCIYNGWRSKLRHIWRFRPNFISGGTFHRIAWIKPGTWTLFIHGRRDAGWGFMRRDVEVVRGAGQTIGRIEGHATYIPAEEKLDGDISAPDWHLTAPTGRELREARGT